MYKLLLVDDEYLELELLEKHVDWAGMGFQVAGTAKNGQEALHRVEALAPDVVITDIKMPVMDGIAFARRLHEQRPNIKIIFLSGYNQFSYLRAAFAVDALDYLMKPIDLDEIGPLMQKVREKCEKDTRDGQRDRQVAASALRRAILIGATPGEEAASLDGLCETLLGETGEVFAALAAIGEYALWQEDSNQGKALIDRNRQYILEQAAEYHAVPVPVEKHTYLYLSKAPILPQPRPWQDSDRGIWAMLCCRREPVPPQELPAVYAQLETRRCWWVAHYPSCPYLYEEEITACMARESSSGSPQKVDYKPLLELLQARNYEETDRWLHNFFTGEADRGNRARVVALFDGLYAELIEPSRTLHAVMEGKASLYTRLFKVESASVMEKLAREFLHGLMDALADLQGDPAQMVVKRIQAYIRQNYAQPLTIDSLVEQFYFSPNYLRTTFKKYANCTVLEYITEVRMQEAARLLADPKLRVSQISEAVGYSNPSYFCLLFAKKYGMTPNQYRNKWG